MRPADRQGWIDVLWVLAFGLVSSAWCLTAGGQIGATFDEPFNLEQGLRFWHTGSFEILLNKGNMPLPDAFCALPVRLYEAWRGSPVDMQTEFDLVLTLARPANLFFWWLLLVYGYIAGRSVSGRWGGRLAVALLACEPTLLAHAALATADIPVAACLLAFAVHFRANRDADWRWRVGLCSVLYAIALLAKASTLAFGVLIMLTLETARVWVRQSPSAAAIEKIRACYAALRSRKFVADAAQIVVFGLVLTFLACGSDRHTEPSFIAWARTLSDGVFGRSMVWLSENLAIFSNAGVALVRQIKHNMQGHGAYLLGATSPRALWYFFPVALTIKLTLAMLMLPIVLAVLSPRSLGSRAMLLTVVFLAFSLNCRVQIGVRLVMPLIAFSAIALGAALGDALTRPGPSWRRKVVAGFATAAVGWMALASAEVWPNGLCYVNEAWGGTANAYKRVSGSDNDWGQGMRDLRRWCDEHGNRVSLAYFGCDPAAGTERFPRFPLYSLSAIDDRTIRAALCGRDLAVSVNLLYGAPLVDDRLNVLLDLLRKREPIARTQFFVIYRFEPSDAREEN